MKYLFPLFACWLFSAVSAQENQPLISGSTSDFEVLIQPASKNVKKYIRNFNSTSKADFEYWQTIPEQVSIQYGFYRIRLSSNHPLLTEGLNIRKVHQQENSNQEVRSLLPKNYYRIEQPNEKTIEIYFSAGANAFFAECPGFVIITGLINKGQEKMQDLLIGKSYYLTFSSKNKQLNPQLLVSR